MSLDIHDLCVGYGPEPVLSGLDLQVATGEILAIQGPSGCGKSTLLRAIAGLIPIRAGRIILDGRDLAGVPTHRRQVGMVFQDNQLFPHRDVAANVEFGLLMARRSRTDRARRRESLLDLVGLRSLAHRRVSELSGGEARRVALARALAPEPAVLLLDEPLSGLDPDLHAHLQVEVPSILRATHTTALWVTHDRAEAAAVADRIVDLGPSQMPPEMELIEITAADTHALRRRVLRVDTPTTEVHFAEDEEPTTWHLGLRETATGELRAISTWLWRDHPAEPGRRGVQLRGMAVDDGYRGRGVGGILLYGGLTVAVERGAEVLWARARDTALGFYMAHGWMPHGEGYIDAGTALTHHDVIRHIE